ncbi:MAG: single-stranded-DNA-specific exonuclease RecJ [Candidatus Moranbacteria bacterium]|nr:single-stranded-DNA-specific exonuclease RecJ [Candidatus Moranbacteria bacterium]
MKKWILKEQPGKAFRDKFSNYSPFVQTLLYQRGIKTKKEAEEFFNLDYEEGLNDPFLLSGMNKAVNRILRSVKKNEKIAIYGDYDADGVTAATVLNQFFRELKVKPVIYIPDRIKEGYGLNETAVDYLKDKKIDLVITVDNGVRNVLEVESFREAGMEVIVTDHHALPDKLPKALAIVNPHLDEKKYPCPYLSGVGVAFKLVQALIQKIGADKFSTGFEKWLLDLVAIGTIADLVPLLRENRILAKYGLIVLAKTKRKGLQEIMVRAGIDLDREYLRSDQVGFGIAPRINAAGRMDHANIAFVLLNEEKKARAEELVDELEAHNKRRQDLTVKIFKEVEKKDFSREKIIIDGDRKWPLGLVGLVSGRLSDKYSKPVLIYMQEKDRIRGSARSIPGFDMVEVLDEVSDLLFEYGGHKQAAGFTVLNENVNEFKRRIRKIAQRKIKKEDMVSKLLIDYNLEFDEIDDNLMDEIKALEPFGLGNEEPVFEVKRARVMNLRMVGSAQKHLKLTVCKNCKKNNQVKYFQCIGFNFIDQARDLNKGDLVDLAFNLYVNKFNGSENLEFRLIDLKIRSKSKT